MVKLRKRPLPTRTSTYVEGSENQTKGAIAEEEALRWLREELIWAMSDWEVLPWTEAKKRSFGLGPFDRSHWVAITNGQNGDLYVYRRGKGETTLWHQPEPELLFSVEVKSSADWPSIAISYSELFSSSAKYLLGITKFGTWICTMEQARKKCRMKETYRTTFYTVDPRDVKLLNIKELINGEEDRHEPATSFYSTGGDYPDDDIPF